MTNIQIRNVPDDVTKLLKKLSKDRGQSLQAFLLDTLSNVANAEKGRLMVSRWPIFPVDTNTIDIENLINAERDERDARNVERVGAGLK